MRVFFGHGLILQGINGVHGCNVIERLQKKQGQISILLAV